MELRHRPLLDAAFRIGRPLPALLVRSFPTTSRPALRAAGGRPPARRRHDGHRGTSRTSTPRGTNHVAGERPSPTSDSCRTLRRLVALPPGRLPDPLGAIPGSLTRIMEPVFASPTTTRTPDTPERGPDPVQHGRLPLRPAAHCPPRPTQQQGAETLNRAGPPARARGATSGPHPTRGSRTTAVSGGPPMPQASTASHASSQPTCLPRFSLTEEALR
jgi:hypothetical protein